MLRSAFSREHIVKIMRPGQFEGQSPAFKRRHLCLGLAGGASPNVAPTSPELFVP
jgi:hypothetical protein